MKPKSGKSSVLWTVLNFVPISTNTIRKNNWFQFFLHQDTKSNIFFFNSKLKVLDLSNNQLEVLPGNLSNMVSLEEINIINNPMIQPPRHICEHGIDAIKAFQDCLKKQLYEPCNRATKVFILGKVIN